MVQAISRCATQIDLDIYKEVSKLMALVLPKRPIQPSRIWHLVRYSNVFDPSYRHGCGRLAS